MIAVEYDDSGLQAKIRGLGQKKWDLRPIWNDVHQVFLDFIKNHFKTEGAYVGDPWVPLNPAYAAWKERTHPDKPMLRLTDRLYNSLTNPKSGEHFFQTGPSFAEMGTKISTGVGWYHQHGTSRGLPKRTVLPKFTQREGAAIVDIILAWILRNLRGGSR